MSKSNSLPTPRTDSVGDYFNTLYSVVPDYQRGYSWTNDQVGDFIDDLISQSDLGRKYFFGPVVVLDNGNKNEPKEIIDGQQRLTTVTIFAATLIEILEEFFDETVEVEDLLDELKSVYIGKGKERNPYRIKQRGSIEKDFTKMFQSREDLDFKRGSSQRNKLVNARNLIKNKLIENTGLKVKGENKNAFKKLDKYFNTLSNDFYVVEISGDDVSDAFQIFQTLNGRGLDLNASDLIKSSFFGSANSNKNNIEKDWDYIQGRINTDDLTNLIRYFWNGTSSFATKRDLYRQVSNKIKNEKSIISFIDDLKKASDFYYDVQNPDTINEDNSYIKEYKRTLINLKTLGFTAFTPIYISAKLKGFEDENISRIMTAVEKYLIREKFSNAVMNNAEKNISKQAIELYKDKLNIEESIQFIEDKMVQDDVNKNDMLFYDWEGNQNMVRYVLKQIEVSRGKEYDLKRDNNVVHIEHIMPKNPDSFNDWNINEEDHENYLWKLGNLTLLFAPINESIGNSSFNLKKEKYKESDLKIVNELVELDSFSKKEIDERTEKLVEEFMNL